MIKDMNKTVVKIDKLIGEFEAIKDGAVVNPKTGKILKDKDGKILYYDNQKEEKRKWVHTIDQQRKYP